MSRFDITCIKVTKDTRDKLKAIGRKDQTYNDILILLMKRKVRGVSY